MEFLGGWWGLLCVIALGLPACVQQSPSLTVRAERGAGQATADAHPSTPAERAFVGAWRAVKQAQWSDALRLLQGTVADLVTVADYGWYYLGTTALKTQRWDVARDAFTHVVEQFPHSPLAPAAADGLIRAALATNDLARAEQFIADRAAHLPSGPTARVVTRQLAMRRAELAWRRGDRAGGAAQLLAQYRAAPTLSDARAIRLRWQALQQGDPFRSLSLAERVALAAELRARDLPREAVRVIRPVATQSAAAEEVYADALFADRQYRAATEMLRHVLERSPTLARRQQYASAALRSQQFDIALRVQSELAQEYAGTADGREAAFKRAFVLFDAGRFGEARNAYSEWLAANPTSSLRDDVAWRLLWCSYLTRDWNGALTALDRIAATPRASYWRGRILEQQGQRAGARAAYESAVGTAYYGPLAQARLHGGAGAVAKLYAAPAAPGVSTAAPIDAPPRLQALQRLGLWDVALDESDRQSGDINRMGPQHEWAVARWGAQWQVAPTVSRALIQQESAFRPQIVSPAGAVGLMQLMPTTAATMARQLGLPDYHEVDLYRPMPNLRLGLWYLHTLLVRYGGALPHVLASYNAGEAAVDRWRQQMPARELDEFVELIPYRETNGYVKKILANIW